MVDTSTPHTAPKPMCPHWAMSITYQAMAKVERQYGDIGRAIQCLEYAVYYNAMALDELPKKIEP